MPPDSVLEHLSVLPRIDRARIEEDSENQVFHLRREVLRLTSINNSVRNEASKEAERMKQRESEWHVTLFERNAELKEANFRISEQSKQIARMQDIILQLKQHISDPNSTSKSDMFMSSPLFMTESTQPEASNFSSKEKERIHLLSTAESKIISLEADIKRLELKNADLQQQIEKNGISLGWREDEIKRLNSLESEIALLTESQKRMDEKIDYLNSERVRLENVATEKTLEVTILTEEHRQMKSKFEKLNTDSVKLNAQLSKAQRNVSALTQEKQTDHTSSNEISIAHMEELKAAKKEIEQLKLTLVNIEKENSSLQRSQSQISQLYSAYHTDKSLFAEALQSKDSELKKCEDLILSLREQLENCELSLSDFQVKLKKTNLENQELSASLSLAKETLVTVKSNSTVTERSQVQLEQALRSKFREEQSWNDEIRILKEEISSLESRLLTSESNLTQSFSKITSLNQSIESLTSQLQHSHFECSSLQNERDVLRAEVSSLSQQLREEIVKLSSCESVMREKTSLINALESRNVALLAEKNQVGSDLEKYSNKCVELESELRLSQFEISQLKSLVTDVGFLDESLNKYKESISNSQIEMSRLVQEVAEGKRKLAVIEHEKSVLNELVTTARAEQKSASVSLASANERNSSLLVTLTTITSERDSLKREVLENLDRIETLKSVQVGNGAFVERHHATNSKLQDEIFALQQKVSSVTLSLQSKTSECEDINRRLERAKSEKDELIHKMQLQSLELSNKLDEISDASVHKASIDMIQENLKRQIGSLQVELNASKANVAKFEAENSEIKLLWKQSEQGKISFERQIKDQDSLLRAANEKVKSLQDQLFASEQKLSDKSTEFNSLRQTLKVLDQRHDQLQMELDARSEQLESLSSANKNESQSRADLVARVNSLTLQLQHSGEALHAKDRDIQTLTMRYDRIHSDKLRIEEENKLKFHELKALAEDIANMTKENQHLNSELAKTVSSCQLLTQQVEQLNSRVYFSEERYTSLESEKMQILQQYRAVCSENSRMEQTLQNLQLDKNDANNEKKYSQQELSKALIHIQGIEAENQRLHSDIRILEQQAQRMTREFAASQMNLESIRNNMAVSQADLDAARKVAVNLQNISDEASRNSAYFMNENRSLKVQCQETLTKISALESQLNHERNRTKDIEGLLSSQRIKEQQTLSAAAALSKDMAQINDSKKTIQNDLQTLIQHVDLFQRSVKRETSALQSLSSQIKSGFSPDQVEPEFHSRVNSLVEVQSSFSNLLSQFESMMSSRISTSSVSRPSESFGSPSPGSLSRP